VESKGSACNIICKLYCPYCRFFDVLPRIPIEEAGKIMLVDLKACEMIFQQETLRPQPEVAQRRWMLI
jgi:hypothetical protein